MTLLESFPQLLKLGPRQFAAIAIITGTLLFVPDDAADRMGIRDLAKDYRQWFGLGFIASVAMMAVHGCEYVVKANRNRAIRAELEKRALQRLNRLTEEEKDVLRPYILQQTKTQKFRLDDGVAGGLIDLGILQQSAPLGSARDGFAYNISDFAWNHLNEQQHLLIPGRRT